VIFAGLFLLLLGVLALAQEGTERLRESRQSTYPAEWIWAPTSSPRDVFPQSFYAVRDFEVGGRFEDARLHVLGDEEYRVYLNGRFLGGNLYHPGAQPDLYQVGPWLLPGNNRLIVQGRSVRGGGGLLVYLEGRLGEGGQPQTLLASDSSWQIQYKLNLGQLRAWAPLEPLEAVHSWGRPPVGRWGAMETGRERSLFDPLATLGADLRPVRLEQDPQHPAIFLLDLGRVVTGYLTLELTPGSGRFARLYLGEDESVLLGNDFYDDGSDSESNPIPIVGGLQETRWQDSLPRRFRYARIVGLDGIRGALVTPADESLAQALAPPTQNEDLLGVEPPPLRSPLDAFISHALQNPPAENP